MTRILIDNTFQMYENPIVTKCCALGKLLLEKQLAYGDSFGRAPKILSILFPSGVPVDRYADMLCIVRVLDKLSRIATDRDAFGESPWNDIAGYAILASVNSDKKPVEETQRPQKVKGENVCQCKLP